MRYPAGHYIDITAFRLESHASNELNSMTATSRPRACIRVLASLCVLTSLTSCGTPLHHIAEEQAAKRAGFVQVSRTTRDEVVRRLGPPGSEFEDGRIAAYALRDSDGKLQLAGTASPDFYLMLVYSPEGVVVRRSLVQTR